MKNLGLALFVVVALFMTSKSYADSTDCGYAKGLAVGAKAMTAYGTSELFFTSTDHSGGIYGTKQRQVDKFVDSIVSDSSNQSKLGKLISNEAQSLKKNIYRVMIDDLGLYNRGIDSIDSQLNSFAHSMELICP